MNINDVIIDSTCAIKDIYARRTSGEVFLPTCRCICLQPFIRACTVNELWHFAVEIGCTLQNVPRCIMYATCRTGLNYAGPPKSRAYWSIYSVVVNIRFWKKWMLILLIFFYIASLALWYWIKNWKITTNNTIELLKKEKKRGAMQYIFGQNAIIKFSLVSNFTVSLEALDL